MDCAEEGLIAIRGNHSEDNFVNERIWEPIGQGIQTGETGAHLRHLQTALPTAADAGHAHHLQHLPGLPAACCPCRTVDD
jgi:hypothetical protein